MAGDWIKVESVTPDKPEIHLMSEALGIDPDAVFGKVFRVWAWADQHTLDGNAPRVTKSSLDRIAGVTGFADAMIACGWLTATEEGFEFPNFARHNGKTAKTRGLAAKRASKHRCQTSRESNASRNGPSVTNALPREEKSKRRDPPPPTPSPPVTDSGGWTDAEVAAVAAEILALGVEDTTPLGRLVNERIPCGEIRAAIAHFREHAAANGWGPEAMHWRLLNSRTGMPPGRGWPPPSTKARQDQRRATEARQQADQKRADSEKSRQSRERFAGLEARYGPILDALPREEFLSLAAACGPLALRAVNSRDGPLPQPVRVSLLMALAKRDGESQADAG